MNDLLLPEQTRLLHIGPHKTGTTALQGALQLARPELPAYGVVYPGGTRQHALAARAALGKRGPRGDKLPSLADWESLVADVSAAGTNRVIISSESFANAEAADARMVVDRLGGSRVHVLVTLRPLAKIMPSAWQQYVREGMSTSYDRWLKGMLLKPPFDKPTPSFWRRHRHEELVERWASVVKPENMTVVMLDDADRGMVTRIVEELVGLPVGILKPEPGRSNRSLTYGEIELVRQVSERFRANEWSDETYTKLIRNGMIAHLQDVYEPQKDEGQIPTPDWALKRIAEIGEQGAETIAGLGVRIVGDIHALGAVDEQAAPEKMPTAPDLSVSLAAEAVVGTVMAANRKRPTRVAKALPTVSAIPTRQLAGVIVKRVSRRVRIRPHRAQPVTDRPAEGDQTGPSSART